MTAVVVKNFPPDYSLDASGKPEGFAIDVINELADIANFRIKYIVKNDWTQTAQVLKDGNANLIPNLGISKIRSTYFDFSKPVETFPVSIIVRTEESNIQSVEDLSGKYVGVVRFNIGGNIIKSLDNVSTIIYEHPENALIGLLAGHVNALIYPKYVMQKIAREANLSNRIKIINPPLKEIKRAIAVRKGNTELLNKLNQAIDKFIPSNKYNTIYEKWYGKPVPFLTVNRIIIIMSSIIILIVIFFMWWRYKGLIIINKCLLETIKARKYAEEALAESNVLLENVLNSTPDLIFVKNNELQTILCNDAYAAAVGKTPKSMLGLTDIENGWDPELVKGNLKKNIQGFEQDDKTVLAGQVIHNTNDPANVNGEIRVFDTHKQPLHDFDGNIIGVLGIAHDISDRIKIENKLQRKNTALLALSLINEAVIHIDKEQKLLDEVCRIITEVAGYRLVWVGFSQHDKIKTIKAVAQSGYEDNYLENLRLSWADTEAGRGPTGTAIRTGKVNFICNIMNDPRYTMWRDSAIERGYCSSIALPLKDKEEIFGALNIYAAEVNAFDNEEICFLQDLTDSLAYGLISLRLQDETKKMDQQLQQAQKMESIGLLTGGIAHDFNNILASILGFTNLALERYVTKEQAQLHDYLTEVIHAGERAKNLIQQMLAFSRSGKSKAVVLSVSSVVNESIKMLQATLPSSIKLTGKVNKDISDIEFDRVQLQQVIINLCINARDVIEGKGCIDIKAKRLTIVASEHRTCDACHNEIEQGDYIELSVHDSGEGINSEVLQKIFEPFFTTKEMGKGTGMGLPIVHGIIHHHGGHIIVESEKGKGTNIRLMLPAIDANKIITTDNLSGELFEKSDCGYVHILVVDDEESVGRFMGELLEGQGYKTTIMDSASHALEVFSKNPKLFDLMLTDQTMPELSGVELAKKYLALRPGFPVILCTGYSENINKEKASAIGIRGYIEKPMKANMLFDLIKSLLAKEI